MADTFFSQLDSAALRALLNRTALHDAALLTVGPTLYIEACNDAAARLTGLHPLERIDQLLSGASAGALRDCIVQQAPRSVYEELDGAEYRLELLPHRGGALLAFLHDNRSSYDGSLRVLHAKSAQYLGTLFACAEQVQDPALAAELRKQCLRMHRILTHSDFLHDPPLTEQLRLYRTDLVALCQTAAANAVLYGPSHGTKNITVHAPDFCDALIEPQLIQKALYNLLSNALHASPAGGDIVLTLTDDSSFATITVADRGPGLDAELFEALLTGWERQVSLDDYLSLARCGAPLGLGLPLIQRIAQAHGGSLLLAPREGGGSELHMSIAHLPAALADNNLRAPMILEEGYSLEEIEFSIFD